MIDIQILAPQLMFLFVYSLGWERDNSCRKKWFDETTEQCTRHVAPIDITHAPAEIQLKLSCLIYSYIQLHSVNTENSTHQYLDLRHNYRLERYSKLCTRTHVNSCHRQTANSWSTVQQLIVLAILHYLIMCLYVHVSVSVWKTFGIHAHTTYIIHSSLRNIKRYI